MRVSTLGTFQNGLASIQRLQASLDLAQKQIASGRRLLVPSDDPVAASRALGYRESIARLDQYDRNAGVANHRLAQEETTLTSVNDVLQRTRELALQANNDSQTNETRQLIAREIRENLDHLVQLANQKDADGNFLFAGTKSGAQPVSSTAGGFIYNGDQVQRFIRIGESREIPDGDNGSAVFFEVRTGNGVFVTSADSANSGSGIVRSSTLLDAQVWDSDSYTVRFVDATNYDVVDSSGTTIQSGVYTENAQIAFQGIGFTLTGSPQAGDEFTVGPSVNQDVFSTLQSLADALETTANNPSEQAQLHNSIDRSLENIDQAIGNVLNFRTQVGTRLSLIEVERNNNADLELATRETLADIEDLDYAAALSQLSQQLATLEAAQQTFVRTQQLSLFNLL